MSKLRKKPKLLIQLERRKNKRQLSLKKQLAIIIKNCKLIIAITRNSLV